MRLCSHIFLMLFIALLAASWSGLTFSQGVANAEPYYKAKTIQIVVGTSAGGFNDLWGRLLGRHLRST
jgi:tripartite-type tricarboxylate transporter receptor subunit TctC